VKTNDPASACGMSRHAIVQPGHNGLAGWLITKNCQAICLAEPERRTLAVSATGQALAWGGGAARTSVEPTLQKAIHGQPNMRQSGPCTC
jgi:hypothetical protein